MKNKIQKIIDKISFFFFGALILLIPFQGFLVTWISFKLKIDPDNNFLLFWKEYFLILLIVLFGIKIFLSKKLPFKILNIDKFIILFFLLVFSYFFIFESSISQKIAGLRYDIELFLFYFLARSISLNKEKIKILIIAFLFSSIIVIIFGLLQISILPPEFMLKFGYSRTLGEYLDTGIISTYELVTPDLPNVYRVKSFFPGALQFSSYLLLSLSFVLSFLIFNNNKRKILLIAPLLLGFFAMFAAHTRSTWIGIFMACLLILFLYVNKKIYIYIPLAIIIFISILSTILFWKTNTFQSIFIHGDIKDGALFGSTIAHYEAILNGINAIISNPFGSGLGSAGPASKFSNFINIPENWYFQIVIEVGVVGLFIVGIIFFFLYKFLLDIYKNVNDNLIKSLSLGLLGSLTGILTSSLFLHTWTDTATAYTFWIFCGILISYYINNHSQKDLSREGN